MTARSTALILPALLLALTAASVSGELNVWFERRMLETVFSRMLMLSSKNPLRPRCKPRGSPDQVQHILPASIERYPIVADSHLFSSLYFDSPSRVGVTLAFDVNSFTIHWSAASRDRAGIADKVQYKFLGLKSHNATVLRNPSLNIPDQGFVPATDSSFQMNLQCSNQVTGITAFEVHVVFQWPDNPERQLMVMQHQFKKACLSSEDSNELQHKCHCRKKCERRIRSRFKRPSQAPAAARRGRKNLRAQLREWRKRLRRRRRRCQERCRRSCGTKPWNCRAQN